MTTPVRSHRVVLTQPGIQELTLLEIRSRPTSFGHITKQPLQILQAFKSSQQLQLQPLTGFDVPMESGGQALNSGRTTVLSSER